MAYQDAALLLIQTFLKQLPKITPCSLLMQYMDSCPDYPFTSHWHEDLKFILNKKASCIL